MPRGPKSVRAVVGDRRCVGVAIAGVHGRSLKPGGALVVAKGARVVWAVPEGVRPVTESGGMRINIR